MFCKLNTTLYLHSHAVDICPCRSCWGTCIGNSCCARFTEVNTWHGDVQFSTSNLFQEEQHILLYFRNILNTPRVPQYLLEVSNTRKDKVLASPLPTCSWNHSTQFVSTRNRKEGQCFSCTQTLEWDHGVQHSVPDFAAYIWYDLVQIMQAQIPSFHWTDRHLYRSDSQLGIKQIWP